MLRRLRKTCCDRCSAIVVVVVVVVVIVVAVRRVSTARTVCIRYFNVCLCACVYVQNECWFRSTALFFFLSKAYSYWIYTIGTADTFRYKLSVLGTVWNVKKKKKKNTCAVLMCACLPAACLHAYSSMLKKNTHFSIWYSLSVNVNRNFDECGSRVLCLYIINKILLYVFVFIISLFSSSSSSPFARTSYSIHLIVFFFIAYSLCVSQFIDVHCKWWEF